jgi:hypothetical protein
MDVISSRSARIDSREDNNIQQGHQQQKQELTTTVEHEAMAAETLGKSQLSTAEGRPARARMPKIVETSQQQ